MENSSELIKILDCFSQVKVLVIGDVMLDRYWWGSTSRLSPEAPVPVVVLNTVSNIPGGAANVAANIAGLGAKVFLAGIIGKDNSADCLCASLKTLGITPDFLLASEERPTTTKTRVIVHNQQIARIDAESSKNLSVDEENNLFSHIQNLVSESDIIVLSDYAKGGLTATLVSKIVSEAQKEKKPILVDPKSKDFRKYDGTTLLTPNLSEAMNATNIEQNGENDLEKAVEKIFSEVAIDSLLVTLSEQGMKLFQRDRSPIHFPSLARQVFDVTGAGDTVIASLAVALGTKSDIYSAISIANIAAGLTVEKVGTSIIPIDELRLALQNEIYTLQQKR